MNLASRIVDAVKGIYFSTPSECYTLVQQRAKEEGFMDFLLSLKWQDVVDILVISFLIHRFFLLFRGTTALQILFGLLFLWLCHTVAQASGLVLTSWFFQGLGAIAVLVIVVVFRNEIRDVVVQTSPARLFLGRPYESWTIDLSELERAVFRLAKNRTGALLVFQQRDRLAQHLSEGIPLHGRWSPEIMTSIFAKESPLHDGATIIQGNRIKSVGAYLPLTKKEGLPRQYGTRHRAAIGLSEMTDVVIVVISEERGEVSVVHRGEVELIPEPPQLQMVLNRLLLRTYTTVKPRTRLRELLIQAAGLLLTFLLVSAAWGIYSGKQLSLINVTTTMDFRNIPENLELRRSSAERVEVQLTGKRRLVSVLKPEQVSAFLDLSTVDEGFHRIVLNGDNVELPPGLEVVRITPAAIRLEMEKRVERAIAVEPNIVGSPPPGFLIDRISVRPGSVRVSGPLSTLNSMLSLNTEPISMSDIEPQRGEKIVKIPVVLSPASIKLLPGQNKEVLVTIQLKSKLTSQSSSK
jgi:diadenylate cyclase